MARKKLPRPEPEQLVARIESFEQTYYLSEDRTHREPVQDEAVIEIIAAIEWVTSRHKQHVGEKIEISLLCAQSFGAEEPHEVRSHPFLLMMNLRKNIRSCMAYLPANAFWSIPQMIEAGRVTHVHLMFEPLNRGSSTLLSVYLIPETKVADLIS